MSHITLSWEKKFVVKEKRYYFCGLFFLKLFFFLGETKSFENKCNFHLDTFQKLKKINGILRIDEKKTI